MKLPIIQKRKLWFIISGAMVGASLLALLIWGFRPGIDFIGGSSWQVDFERTDITAQQLSDFLASQEMADALGLEDALIPSVTRELSSDDYIMRVQPLTEEQHQTVRRLAEEEFGSFMELRFDSIGPAIGQELREKAIWAAILVLLGISFFVAYSFRRVSYPVSSWRYGIVALMTLFHDVAIVVGLLVLLGEFRGVEMDSNMIVAILVTLGFSVNDTIVVFDRIRENLRLASSKIDFESIVNRAVNDTIGRSINTSATLFVVLIALLLFGPASLKFFFIALIVGVLAGTYSSIFVASPLLVQWYEMNRKK